jgi:hypothetical protein
MTEELMKLIKVFAIGAEKDLQEYIDSKSPSTISNILKELLSLYLKDKNSSFLREFLTVSLAGYEPRPGKIGYNGYIQNANGETKRCEAKPKEY